MYTLFVIAHKTKYNATLNNLYNNKCTDFCEVDSCTSPNAISKLMTRYTSKETKSVETNVEHHTPWL